MSESGENIHEEKRQIATQLKDLPALKEEHARLVHFTNEKLVESILEKGLDYSRQGMVMSTALAYSDENDVQYVTDDPRFSGEGVKAVILDVPFEEYKLHNNISKAPGIIPNKYIVGAITPQKGTGK